MTLPLPPSNDIFPTPNSHPATCKLRNDSSTYYALPCDKEPTLVSSCENYRYCLATAQHKRTDLIDRLVETSTEIIDSIWSNTVDPPQQPNIKVVSTRAFIQEILRRSKTTYSNLQVCLFYLFRVKKAVLIHLERMGLQQEPKSMEDNIISCGRRMFLASLMVAAKFLQDKNYRNRAWSRLSGLALSEINAAEITFLKLINYNLYISKSTFDRWYTLLQSYLYRQPRQHHNQIPFYQSPTCLTCYNMTHIDASRASACMMCYYLQCSEPPPFSSNYQPWLERPSSFAYPSPPSDDLNPVLMTPTDHRPIQRNKRRMNNDDDDNDDGDQDHFNIKRSCIDIQ